MPRAELRNSPSEAASALREAPPRTIYEIDVRNVVPTAAEQCVIDSALDILSRCMRQPGPQFGSADAAKTFAVLSLGLLEHEVFAVLFLDYQNRLIKFETMFRGTLTQTSVYPREVARRALELNSAAVIFAHNHPSGTAEPSRADEFLTHSLKVNARADRSARA